MGAPEVLRVVYISASSIPSLTANSIQVMKMCQALTQEGYSVELLAPLWQRNAPKVDEGLWQHYGVRVPFPITWIPAGSWLKRRTCHVPAAWRARTSHADLVYTRHAGAAAMSSLLGISTIYEAHDLPGGKMGPLYFRAFLMARGFRRLVVISQALQHLLHQRYSTFMRGKSVVVAHDGVDLERFDNLPTPAEARRRLGLDPECFTVGYTGHLYTGRGIELILSLAETCKYVDFLVVGGDRASVTEWTREAEQLSLTNLQFKGFIGNAEVPLYQAACEVLLMPYQRRVAASGGGNIAGFLSPMKMFEYMATERLIISSNLPVLQEVLNEHNAVLCDPEDGVAWRDALERAIADPEWRHVLGQQARRDVEQYSWRRRVRRVLAECHI